MDILAIENYLWNPHIETSIEICIQATAGNKRCGFLFLDIENLDDPDVNFNFFGLFGKKRKLRLIKKIIKKNKIHWIHSSRLCVDQIAITEQASVDAISSLEQISRISYEGANIGFGVASSIVDKAKQESPAIERCIELGVENYLKSAMLAYSMTKDAIQKYKPKSILTFNGRFAVSRAIVLAAEDCGVGVLYHERVDLNDRYRVDSRSPHDYGWWESEIKKTWNSSADLDEAKIIAERYYSDRIDSGKFNENFNHRKFIKNGELPRFFPNKFRHVFFSKSDYETAYIAGLKNEPFKTQRECIKWLINFYDNCKDIQFILRVHPNLVNSAQEDIDWWHKLSGKNLTLIKADESIDSYELVKNSNLTISYGNATINLEATYLGKPSIAIGKSIFREVDAAYHPESIKELTLLLQQEVLKPKCRDSVYPYAYFRSVFGIPYKYYKVQTLNSKVHLGEICGVSIEDYPKWALYIRRIFKSFSDV